MKRINDGGPAFARPAGHWDGENFPGNEHQDGMSLRAYIAAKVFAQHEAVEYVTNCSGEDLQRRARNAVTAADALIAALARIDGEESTSQEGAA